MVTSPPTKLTFLGKELDTSPDAFGLMRSSTDLVDNVEAIRHRLEEEGYVYRDAMCFLPGR